MMTLEEAIKHYEQRALVCSNSECSKEYIQLLDWLRELQELRSYTSNTVKIRERAKRYSKGKLFKLVAFKAYLVGAKEQKTIDTERSWSLAYSMYAAGKGYGCPLSQTEFIRIMNKE